MKQRQGSISHWTGTEEQGWVLLISQQGQLTYQVVAGSNADIAGTTAQEREASGDDDDDSGVDEINVVSSVCGLGRLKMFHIDRSSSGKAGRRVPCPIKIRQKPR